VWAQPGLLWGKWPGLKEQLGLGDGTGQDADSGTFLRRYLDYFHVMTYDFHGSWDTQTGENSPLYQGPSDTGDNIYFNVVSIF